MAAKNGSLPLQFRLTTKEGWLLVVKQDHASLSSAIGDSIVPWYCWHVNMTNLQIFSFQLKKMQTDMKHHQIISSGKVQHAICVKVKQQKTLNNSTKIPRTSVALRVGFVCTMAGVFSCQPSISQKNSKIGQNPLQSLVTKPGFSLSLLICG